MDNLASVSPHPEIYRLYCLYKQLEKSFKFSRRHKNALRKQQRDDTRLSEKYYDKTVTAVNLDALYAELTRGKAKVPADLIYQYWHHGNTAEKADQAGRSWHLIHQLSVNSIDRYYADKHLILDADSLFEYLNFPQDIFAKLTGLKRYAMLADLIRTALLFCYGGTWIDFTMVLLNQIPKEYLKPALFLPLRSGSLEIDSMPFSNLQQRFEIFSPYYFSWSADFKVTVLNSFIHARHIKHPLLGTMLQIMFDFARHEEPHAWEYLVYQITMDHLLLQPEYAAIKQELSQYPSDACYHILQAFDYLKYDSSMYTELKQKFPLQKLNRGVRFIKHSLLYETLKQEGLVG